MPMFASSLLVFLRRYPSESCIIKDTCVCESNYTVNDENKNKKKKLVNWAKVENGSAELATRDLIDDTIQ